MIFRATAPPIEEQVADIARDLHISGAEVVERLAKALNDPVIEPLNITYP